MNVVKESQDEKTFPEFVVVGNEHLCSKDNNDALGHNKACSRFTLTIGLPSLMIYPTLGLPYQFSLSNSMGIKITIVGLPYL